MFKHILVPLDGSELAESALGAAAFLARVSNARVTLIHIIEADAPEKVHGERHLKHPAEASGYLEDTRRRAFPPDLTVEVHVHTAATRDVARGIVEHQAELTPDLIVMCTHGRGGLRRLIAGSIAQQVVASGGTPVLLMPPDTHYRREPFLCTSLLAPDDGDPMHEQGLRTAADLALATGAMLVILSVIPTIGTLAGADATVGRFMPATVQAALDIAEEDRRKYLQERAARIEARGIVVLAEIRHGETSSVIIERARSLDSSIIVLGTHGKSGADAFWANSVGAKVQAQTRRPLLLVPVLSSEGEAGG